MFVKKSRGPRTAHMADGSILTLADLPEVGMRWVARRKAIVVAAVKYGLLSKDDVIKRYDLSEEEFDTWAHMIERHGRDALKITQLQKFKQP
ncbi:DUF1153 domain-containing protein [Paracoccus aestuariivivens]|uniref:DUF1153 domain-containing protein n=1 Tax=Paracoccus aestuariivivens TaxID=1820333 RepID=A0A6L6J8J1_9RHOB|nr:DUF1153 domain-containing protein [Paracoccus aestuariivivens]MTH77488.1 DUF1153 domain-containing protein [Paracoccus aestuariivivens]